MRIGPFFIRLNGPTLPEPRDDCLGKCLGDICSGTGCSWPTHATGPHHAATVEQARRAWLDPAWVARERP